MKKLLILLCLCSLLIGCQAFQQAPQSEGRELASASCPPDLGQDLEDFKTLSGQALDLNGRLGSVESLDLSKMRGKVVALRLIGTWCPYCKSDLVELSKKFLNGKDEKKLELVLIANSSRRENEATVSAFRREGAKKLGLQPKQFQFWFVGPSEMPTLTGLQRLAQATSPSGDLLFPEYKAVPYALVFDKKGRLRVRGLFTSSDEAIKAHYSTIEALITKCNP